MYFQTGSYYFNDLDNSDNLNDHDIIQQNELIPKNNKTKRRESYF